MVWLSFVLGAWLGGFVGAGMMALCNVAAAADQHLNVEASKALHDYHDWSSDEDSDL